MLVATSSSPKASRPAGTFAGRLPLLELLPAVVGAVAVPVLASGGIGTAHDVVAALAAGAFAARVETRFLATEESAAHPDYIARLLAARADDTVLTEAFSHGWPQVPHRVLRSCVDAAEALPGGDVAQVRRGVQSAPVPRWSSMPPTRAVHGHVAAMAHYAGESVDAVRAVAPAEAVVRELTALLD